MRHELTTWVHSGPVAREQAAEQWTDRQHVLGHELVVASQKQAAQQSHQHKVDMLRINLEQNEWEEEQAELMEGRSKRQRLDPDVIDLTKDSAAEVSEDDEAEQSYEGPTDEELIQCHECERCRAFCSANGCLSLYCNHCAEASEDDQGFAACSSSGCCGTKLYCEQHKAVLQQCDSCQKYVCYKHPCANCEGPCCAECLDGDVCEGCRTEDEQDE